MTEHDEMVRHLRARLPDCGPGLCQHYADQVGATGVKTTAADAFEAWAKWLCGDDDCPYVITDWGNGFHNRTAWVIREVARYYPTN